MSKELEHSVITALACVGALLIGYPLLCFAMPFVFIGREHAQAEYRWIETFGSHRRAYLPWWGGFDRRVWDVHSWWWNLLLPWAIALASFMAIHFQSTFIRLIAG